MTADDITCILKRTLEHLHAHFETEMVPDDEYIPLTRVVIASGTKLMSELSIKKSEISTCEKELTQFARNSWLDTCARAHDPSVEPPFDRRQVGKEFDRMFRGKRTPR